MVWQSRWLDESGAALWARASMATAIRRLAATPTLHNTGFQTFIITSPPPLRRALTAHAAITES